MIDVITLHHNLESNLVLYGIFQLTMYCGSNTQDAMPGFPFRSDVKPSIPRMFHRLFSEFGEVGDVGDEGRTLEKSVMPEPSRLEEN